MNVLLAALLLLGAPHVAAFSTVPSDEFPPLPLPGGRAGTPEGLCVCDYWLRGNRQCKDLDVTPATLEWCIERCYPRYGDSDACARSRSTSLRHACAKSTDVDVNFEDQTAFQFIIERAQPEPYEDFCPPIEADPSCPDVVGSATQLARIPETGLSDGTPATLCGQLVDVPVEECGDYFVFSADDPQFVYFCVPAAQGCAAPHPAAKLYCGPQVYDTDLGSG